MRQSTIRKEAAGFSRWRVWMWRTVVVAMILITFCTMLSSVTSSYSEHFLMSLDGPLKADDPELIHFVREQVLDPPSQEPYNLLGEANDALLGVDPSEVFYKDVLPILFEDKRDGFFVEAGALDGETMSNTLWLEQEMDWTGLLVEADKAGYKSLLSKHRRAWSANVCLSPHPYPSKEMFGQTSHYEPPLARNLGFKVRAMHSLAKFTNQRKMGVTWFAWVQCIPLQTLLMALEVKTVDLLVLDVEGAEMAILDHFDLDKFNVQVICMEWKRVKEMEEIVEKFAERGYVEVERQYEDLVLVRKGSPYEYRINKTSSGEETDGEERRTVNTVS